MRPQHAEDDTYSFECSRRLVTIRTTTSRNAKPVAIPTLAVQARTTAQRLSTSKEMFRGFIEGPQVNVVFVNGKEREDHGSPDCTGQEDPDEEFEHPIRDRYG
ncbi:hypothetical protein Aduo_003078 [Ancylostoma duodenale]